jgi:hypothetical protein
MPLGFAAISSCMFISKRCAMTENPIKHGRARRSVARPRYTCSGCATGVGRSLRLVAVEGSSRSRVQALTESDAVVPDEIAWA